MTTDDNVKKQLVDRLSEEPPMVLATAYAYAKNYVNYGEDITKAWTTAVQQASIIEKVKQQTWTKAYDSFKADYETRLKADMVAMLTELKKEIEEQSKIPNDNMSAYDWNNGVYACYKVVQQKIDKLKENTDGNKND
jgi:LmbE family N-acetylglucosaminyl deacetylase